MGTDGEVELGEADDPIPGWGDRSRRCERCHDELAAWELAPIGGVPELLGERCASLRVGTLKGAHPIEVLRSHLKHLPAADRARRAPVLGDELRAEAAAERARAIRELHNDLKSWSKVGQRVGLTPARAANVASGADRRRREADRRVRRFATDRPIP